MRLSGLTRIGKLALCSSFLATLLSTASCVMPSEREYRYVDGGIALERGSHKASKQMPSELEFLSDAHKQIYEDYGIYVTNKPHLMPTHLGFIVSTRGISNKKAIGIIDNLLPEIAKYDKRFFENINLENIFIGDGFTLEGTRWGGFPDKISGVYISRASGLHHEAYHQADYIDGGYENDNAEWAEISGSPCVEEEKKGGVEAIKQGKTGQGISEEYLKQGSLNEYSMCSIDEDQAEIWEFMMSANYDADLYKITGINPDEHGDNAKRIALTILSKMYPAIREKIEFNQEFYKRLSEN